MGIGLVSVPCVGSLVDNRTIREDVAVMLERLLANLLLVVGVLALSWGPVLYLLHTVQLARGL